MLNCTTDRYAELYAPWLQNSSTLLRLAGFRTTDSLLDLCGGTGAVTNSALYSYGEPDSENPPKWRLGRDMEHKPDITLFDLNPRAEGPWVEEAFHRGFLRVASGRAENVDQHLGHRLFDVVVIRQAVAYLNVRQTFEAIAKVMPPGGRLVFNTFIHPLARGVKRYSTKNYEYEGERFFEMHFAAFSRVLHLQAKLSGRRGFDVTFFKYQDMLTLTAALLPYFTFEFFPEGRTVRWRCIRKPFSYAAHYLGLCDKLEDIRDAHNGDDSPEESALMEEMDWTWDLCTSEQHERLNEMKLREDP